MKADINEQAIKDEIMLILDGKNKNKDKESQISVNKLPKGDLDTLIEKAILNNDINTLKEINAASIANIQKCRIGKNKENVMIHSVKTLSIAAFKYFMMLPNVACMMKSPSQKGEVATHILFEKDNVELFEIFCKYHPDYDFVNNHALKFNIIYHILENENIYGANKVNIKRIKSMIKNSLTCDMSLNDLTLGLTFIKGELNKAKISEDVLISNNIELLKKLLNEDMFDLSSSFCFKRPVLDLIIENKAWSMFNVFFKAKHYKDDFVDNISNEKLNKFLIANAASVSNINKLLNMIFKNSLINDEDPVKFMNLQLYRGVDSASIKANNIVKVIMEKEELLFPYHVNMDDFARGNFESLLYFNEKDRQAYKAKVEKYKIIKNAGALNSDEKTVNKRRL